MKLKNGIPYLILIGGFWGASGIDNIQKPQVTKKGPEGPFFYQTQTHKFTKS